MTLRIGGNVRHTRFLETAPLVSYVARKVPWLPSNAAARSLGLPRRSWDRWRAHGRIALDVAEDAAAILGVHPVDIWGLAYYEVAA